MNTHIRTNELDNALDALDQPAPAKIRKPKTKKLNRVEEMQIIKLLERHITKLDDDMCRYENGMSDEKIAETCGIERANRRHVIAIRSELFGRIHAAPDARKPKRLSTTEQRVEQLEKRVDELETLFLKLAK